MSLNRAIAPANTTYDECAREGAQFVRDRIVRVTETAIDDFAGGGSDEAANCRMLGID